MHMPHHRTQTLSLLTLMLGMALSPVASAELLLLSAAAPAATTANHPTGAAIRFSQLDQNKDGKISPVEAEFDTPLSAQFKQFDGNRDSALDISEFVGFHLHDQRNPQLASSRHDQ